MLGETVKSFDLQSLSDWERGRSYYRKIETKNDSATSVMGKKGRQGPKSTGLASGKQRRAGKKLRSGKTTHVFREKGGGNGRSVVSTCPSWVRR